MPLEEDLALKSCSKREGIAATLFDATTGVAIIQSYRWKPVPKTSKMQINLPPVITVSSDVITIL